MKIGKSILCVGLVSAMLMGCGVDNNNDRFADDNNDGLTDVGYAPKQNSYQNNDNFNTRNVGYNQDGTNNRNGTMNNRGNNNNGNNNVEVADEVAEKIDRLTEVDSAYVLVTDNNAYVAVRLESNQNNRLVGNIETKITEIVKNSDKSIDNVYISENPDFFEHVNNYRNDVRNGRPVAGFFDEFSNMVERIFPNRR